MEPISSHAEHARKCLKVEYLGRIENDFKKSRVTGPWDHKDSVSVKKVKKKISCLCTFKGESRKDVLEWLNWVDFGRNDDGSIHCMNIHTLNCSVGGGGGGLVFKSQI